MKTPTKAEIAGKTPKQIEDLIKKEYPEFYEIRNGFRSIVTNK